MASGMPAEFVKELTGHDLSKISALFEYIEATRALTMPGCAVLAGWPAPPWGQLGRGPQAASLAPLDQFVSRQDLNALIDATFDFNPELTSPCLLEGGSVREGVKASYASQLMYFENRLEAGECRFVLVRMRDAVALLGRRGINLLEHSSVSSSSSSSAAPAAPAAAVAAVPVAAVAAVPVAAAK